MNERTALGLGIIVLISGIVLVLQQQYVIGVSGAVVGLGLAVQNLKKIRARSG